MKNVVALARRVVGGRSVLANGELRSETVPPSSRLQNAAGTNVRAGSRGRVVLAHSTSTAQLGVTNRKDGVAGQIRGDPKCGLCAVRGENPPAAGTCHAGSARY